MTFHDASEVGFSHRPLGTRAVQEKRATETHEVVLRLDEASVRLAAVRQERDGSYFGIVAGVAAHGAGALSHIVIGDGIAFRGFHVFTFSGPAKGQPPESSDRDTASRGSRRPERSAGEARHGFTRATVFSAAFALFAAGASLGYLAGAAKESAGVPHVNAAQTPGGWRLKVDYVLKSR